MVLQLVLRQERGKGFGKAGQMLGDIDEGYGKIARGAEH